MSEFDTGGWSDRCGVEGRRSRETPRQSSRALNWIRAEYALFLARVQASRSGEEEEGSERRAETAWSDVVWAWARRRATATASSSAWAASCVKHCLAVLTGVGIAGEHKNIKIINFMSWVFFLFLISITTIFMGYR